MTNKVLMYSTGVCPYCQRAEMLLNSRGVTEIEKVSRVIAAYGEQVEETLASTRDPRQGIYERDMIDRLREDIEQFRRQVRNERRPGSAPRTTGISARDTRKPWRRSSKPASATRTTCETPSRRAWTTGSTAPASTTRGR